MNLKFDLDTTLGDVRSALDRADILSAISILEKLKQTEQSQVFDELAVKDQADLITELNPQDSADILSEMDPGDAADIVSELEPHERAELISELEPQDSAEIVSELEPHEQAELIQRLTPEDAADIVVELDDEEQADIAGRVTDAQLSRILDEMEPDDAADVLGDLDEKRQQRVLSGMTEADDVRPLLIYPDESAGGLMTTSFLTLRPAMTAQDAINALREWSPEDELPYYLFVVDGERKLAGVVSLRALVTARPSSPISTVMNPDVVTVLVGTDQEECANLLRKYGFLALPVVDVERRLLGVITNDDLVEVVEEEAVEDAFRLSGVSDEESVFSPLSYSMRKRLPWLVINLATAFLAAWVFSLFEATVARLAVLAALPSIVAGQGGNSATQRIAIIVRGFATGEFELKDSLRVLGKEVFLGLLQGLVMALLVGTGVALWQGSPLIGLILGAAMIGNLIVAGLVGASVPIILHRVHIDPALASAVIVTTFTDCCGFAFSLGLATLLLRFLV